MNGIKTLQVAVVLAVAFASNSMASLIGSTFDYTGASSGGVGISPSGGPIANQAGFCVTGDGDLGCGQDEGVSVGFSFGDIDATDATITFNFTGSTTPIVGGQFSVDLGNFVTPDGSIITGITYGSGSLNQGTFALTSFDGSDAIFSGLDTGFGFDAVGGKNVVFDVTLADATPEPASVWLSGLGLAALGIFAKRRVRA